MADYLCLKADLGFFSDGGVPYPLLCAFGCDEAAVLTDMLEQLKKAFEEERLLFTAS